MNLSYPEEYYSKSSSEETDQNDDIVGSGSRSYECIFCKRGFTTAQALGGHMNIHRKDKLGASKNKPTFPLISISEIPSHPTLGRNNNYYSTVDEVDANNNYRQVYNFPETTCGIRPSQSHVDYSDVLCVENQQDHHHLFGQDWRQRNLNLYTNPFCVGEIKDKFEDNEEDGLDLELRLGRQP